MRVPRSLILPAAALAVLVAVAVAVSPTPKPFRAGACVVDISPAQFPVVVNAMFTERSASRVVDPLHARALALDDGSSTVVICVVDTCMMPRELIDRAKGEASRVTGVPADHLLVSATHTHSAPSAMGCLGSRVDPDYASMLPGKIVEAIVGAWKDLRPARIGWTAVDDWDHTFNRRWIRRPDRLLNDPFGVANVRANMHPGHESPDAIGPSGPVDPQLSILAVQSPDGRPIALMANYSMHYYGSDLLSSDYFGRFATYVGERIGATDGFVGIMSQGTSGDLMWMDYGAPAKQIGYDAYAREMASRAAEAYAKIQWHDTAPLKMAQRTLGLNYRVPDEARLARAREVAARLDGRLPQSQEEIYALEAIHLHDRQKTDLVLQAIRIGDLGLTALPNEVFALTGLKVKAASPFATTMNIELANGAEGYIPPPEQHALGGYTTWPARTAGLEVQAEPRIVETAVSLLEEVAGRPRRQPVAGAGAYARAVIADKPVAYWRMEEMAGAMAHDGTDHGADARLEDGIAHFLPGVDGRVGHGPPRPPVENPFSGPEINRSAHFAGGRLRADLPLGESYSIELWLWNGLPADARPVTGYVFSRGPDGDAMARGEHLGIGGTYRGADGLGPDISGRLILFNGNERNDVLAGRTPLALRAWHHVVMVREGTTVRVHLDGRTEPEISGPFIHTVPSGERSLFIGGRNDKLFNFEGRLDEIAIHPRALTPTEIAAHYASSALVPPVPAVAAAATPAPVSPALSPLDSMKKIHVRPGYGFELVAAEPLLADPVAIDWDLAGRLWVVEMADYPLGLDGQGGAGGRVRVLDDTDGDGRYDKSTLFAEGLNFPTGLLTWRDGVIVTAAPDVLFLRDSDGDGRADVREVLITGLLEGNQQLRANGLRWGLDNWVYCAAGGHHGEYGVGTKLRSARTGEEVLIGSRDFRFRPDTGELEPQSGPSQFGRNRDDWGHWFGTQNSRPLWHYVLPDHYLRRNPHVPAPDPTHQVVTPLNPRVWPVSPAEKRFHSYENAGHFTSACSGMIYRDDLLFPAGGMHAFTCEPFHNLVQHNVIVDDGVTFSAHRDPAEVDSDFFASEDRWCRPVMTRTGPDGALWVVDMYRYMIEHPDWLPANGKAELLPHYRLGEDKGRLYRVFPIGAPRRTPVRLDQCDVPQLIAALDSANEWQRDKAHMALLWTVSALPEPDRPAAVAQLIKSATDHPNPLARVHLMSLLDGLRELPVTTLVDGLRATHPGVREVTLRLAEGRTEPALIESIQHLTDDPDAKVRLQVALSLGSWPAAVSNGSDPIGSALGKLAVRESAEPFMRAAVLSSATGHCRALAAAVAEAGEPSLSAYLDELVALALAMNERDALADLLGPVLTVQLPPGAAYSVSQMETWAKFQDLLARHQSSGIKPVPDRDALAARLDSARAMLTFASGIVADETRPVAERAAAAHVLVRDPGHRKGVLSALAHWLGPQRAGELQQAAVGALAASTDDSVPATLLAAWASLSPQTRISALDALLGRESWAFALARHLKAGSALPLDAAQRTRLIKHSSARVRELAANLGSGTASRIKVVEQFQPALKLTGDAVRGQGVFARLCVGCHKLGDLGNNIGPDLRSVVEHSPEKLLTNILDPNADVQPGFYAYHCEIVGGRELYGLIASETGNSITFMLADGTTPTVLRRDIKSLAGANVSLMPEGLEAGLTPQDLADLIQWLRAGATSPSPKTAVSSDLRVGAAAVNLKATETMPLAGYLESRFTNEQEGELRAVAVVVEKPGGARIAIVACDVLWVTRAIVDAAVVEIERTTGIPAANVMVNATHTHHAPGTAPAHGFGWSEAFATEVRLGIVESVREANARLADAALFFYLGEEQTVGANSRLLLRDGSISWLNPAGEAGFLVQPTGPFDPQLPVLDFRGPDGLSRALIFNHSTHTIGTRSGRDVRSPSFYGLAAQELEKELGGVVSFVEGASGSTHNIRGVSVPLAIERMKRAVIDARAQADPHPVSRVASLKRPFSYRVRTADEPAEEKRVATYTETYAKESASRIREIFAVARRELRPKAGEERTTWLQAMVIGDIAFVGVPAEYFTVLGLEIKRRSPFKRTYVAELANDWIGYLPNREAHALGGYQTWTGLHSYTEPGTGERVADEVVKMLDELAVGR